jgi:hypothetical protein
MPFYRPDPHFLSCQVPVYSTGLAGWLVGEATDDSRATPGVRNVGL